MSYKIGDRKQQMLLPAMIEDYVGLEDPVRVYDAFVEALDFKTLGIPIESSAGAEAYYPKDLLKLIIYGYSYGIRSSRKLERACHHNLSFQWMVGGQKPDYRTIARFRSKHKKQIKEVLKQCVRICMDLNLIEGNTLFIDGSKFRANASINQNWNKERCEKYLIKVNAHIDNLLEESDKIDKNEEKEKSMVKLREQIKDKKKLVEKIQGVMEQLKGSEKESINSTDSDCVKAKGRQGIHASYNVQMSVDDKHGLIVHSEGISKNNDLNQLNDQLKKATDILRKKPKNVCADAGYSSIQDIVKIDKDVQVILPSSKQIEQERGKISALFDKKHFQYDKEQNQYICPEGKNLPFKGFDKQRQVNVYQADSKECRGCQHFNICTSSKSGRKIKSSIHEKRKEELEKDYKSSQGQEIYQLRKEKVEHPFGHLKRNLGAGQFMLRGKDNINAEVSVLSTCFNIARMITIIGVPELIVRLNGG